MSRKETPIEADALVFEAVDYQRALDGAAPVSTWEPRTRQAALLAKEAIDGVNLERLRLRGPEFDHRGDHELIVAALLGRRGEPDWGILRLTLAVAPGERAESLAERAVMTVTNGSILEDPTSEHTPFGPRRGDPPT